MMKVANLLISLGVAMMLYALCDIQIADVLMAGVLLYIGLSIGDTAQAIRKLKE